MAMTSSGGRWTEQVKSGVKRVSKVGIVVANMQKSSTMISHAVSARRPLYEARDGQKHTFFGDMQEGDILWAYRASSTQGSGYASLHDDRSHNSQFSPFKENATISTLATLNGHGTNTDTRTTFQSKIRIVGVVDETVPDTFELGTVAIGGLMGVRNNGDEKICDGDLVMAVAPDPEKANKKGGLIKLEYRPYRPEMHRSTPKEIYMCLLDSKKGEGRGDIAYLKEYRNHSTQFVDGVAGMHMVISYANWEEMGKIMAGKPTAENLAKLLRLTGHSEYNAEGMNRRTLDHVFAPHSHDPATKMTPFMFPRDTASAQQKKLNRIQAESAAKFFASTAFFVEEILAMIIGVAHSDARKDDWFSLHLTSYSMR